MKLYICIRLRRQIINFLEFGEAIYTDDASPTSNRQNCLRKCAKQSYHYLGLLLSVSVIGALLFVAYPLYLLAFENKRTWILPVLIPGTTLDTFAEYYTNITYQVACSLIALCGSTGYDCYFTLCVCHYSTCVALIESTANETVADRDRRWRIRALILQLQDIDSFIVQMNNLNKGVLLVQPLASAFSISLSLFCIITNDWIAGYGYVIFAFTKMLSLCAVGQSVQNDVSAFAYSPDVFEFHRSDFSSAEYEIGAYSLRIAMVSLHNRPAEGHSTHFDAIASKQRAMDGTICAAKFGNGINGKSHEWFSTVVYAFN